MARYTGGFINSTEFTSNRFGLNSGMFTLGQQLGFNAQGAWPSDYDVVLQFNGSGTWECPTDVTEISEYLIVAGGGGAGGYNNPTSGFYGGGGGGAGGIVSGTGISVVPGKTYDIQTGAGGVGRGGGDANSSNGINSAIKTEANVLYYVAVGAAVSPGTGNRYYVKTFNEFSGATANVEAETLKLYEGSTYRFDQSHPSNSGHPFRFSTTDAPSHTGYTTGVSSNQPSAGGVGSGSTAAGTPGSIVQIQVATPAPQLYYYCTSHPVSGSASMGGAADTIANVTVTGIGGGRCAPNQGDDGGSGGGSGLFAPGSGSAGNALQPSSASGGSGNNGGSNAPSATNAQGGGGGGAGEPGENGFSPGTGTLTKGGKGGNGIHNTISGSNIAYGGGGGGGGGDTGGLGGFGGGGDGGSGLQSPSNYVKVGGNGTVNTGGGGGGAMTNGPNTDELGGIGGSGIVFLKYKNKLSNRVFKFTGSSVWKNVFNAKTVDYLVLAGGGAGGADNPYSGGGGGGAGGLRMGSGLDVSVLNELTIQVGGGGVGGTGGAGNAGTSGTGSFIQNTLSPNNFHLGSNGGGSGGRYHVQGTSASEGGGGAGDPGGSGGGGGSNRSAPGGWTGGKSITFTTANGHASSFSPLSFTQSNSVAQGTSGGEGSHVPASHVMQGGGGGAGGAGEDSQGAAGAGNGGVGLSSTIEGRTLLYAGGGGGGASPSPTAGGEAHKGLGSRDPVYNNRIVGGNGGYLATTEAETSSEFTGGGGGGQGHFMPGAPQSIRSGDGGSGIVVIKITG